MFRFLEQIKECEKLKNDSAIFLLHEHSAVCHETSGWSVRCSFIADPSRYGKEQCNEKDSAVYENLYTELEDYEKKGVCILIDGNSASPMQVVRQHMVREAGSYMRDYEIDPEGHIESLSL